MRPWWEGTSTMGKGPWSSSGCSPRKGGASYWGSISRGTQVRIQGVSNKMMESYGIPSWELAYPIKNIQKTLLKMIFLFPRWDMLVPWRVFPPNNRLQCRLNRGFCKKIPPCQGGKHQQFGTSSVASKIFHRTSNRNNILSTKIAILHHLGQIRIFRILSPNWKNPKWNRL